MLFGKSKNLADDPCFGFKRNGLTVNEDNAVGDAAHMFALDTAACVDGFPFVRASRILHFCGYQFEDGA